MPTTLDPNAINPGANPPGNGLLNTAATSTLAPAGGAPPVGAAPNAPANTYAPSTGTAGVAAPSAYTATPYKVENEGLVENRIKGIVAADSPLMQQARDLANVNSNARGMLNSSIGTAAAHSAVIGAATPIATTDAGSINAAMTNTANAQNAASQFNTGQENESSRLNANLLSQMNAVNANAENAALNLQAQAQNTQILSRLDQAQKLQMQQVMQNQDTLIQQNASAAQLSQQSMTNISNIQTSTTLDEANKRIAIDAQMTFLRDSLAAINKLAVETPGQIASLGIKDLFSGVRSPTETRLQRQSLTTAVTDARNAIPVWGQNIRAYTASEGRRQSERTGEMFAMQSSTAQAVLKKAQQALADFNAANPV